LLRPDAHGGALRTTEGRDGTRSTMRYQEIIGLAQALFEESADALFLLDASAENVLDANGAAQRLSGLPLRDLLASSVSELFQFDDIHELRPIPANSCRGLNPSAVRHGHFRTIRPAIWLPVDVRFTQLLVRPHRLTLLLVRDTNSDAHTRYIAVESERSLCVNCGERIGYSEDELPVSPGTEQITNCMESFIGQAWSR
jgi:PAS domain-containing protein